MAAGFEAKSHGCLLGAAVGDALGAGCEMMTADSISKHYGRVVNYIPEAKQQFPENRKRPPGCYTDDTEMSLGLALSLIGKAGIVDTKDIAEYHLRLYSPWRGYGRGTTKVLEALGAGADLENIGVELTRPSYEPKSTWMGSNSNGGSMRIHPLGVLAAVADAGEEKLRVATKLALLPTHTHPEAVDAAYIQASAVQELCRQTSCTVRISELLANLQTKAETRAMQTKLKILSDGLAAGKSEIDIVDNVENGLLGMDGVKAVEAVACALCCLAFHADNPSEGMIAAVGYGGDCDTIPGMAGALFGALHGLPSSWMPPQWISDFEPKGHGGFGWTDIESVATGLVSVGTLEVTTHG